MSERLSWFMGVMQAWFNRPDKLAVICQHRDCGRKIEKWLLVEMGAALDALKETSAASAASAASSVASALATSADKCAQNSSFGFGCHELELEKCPFFVAQEYVAPERRRPGVPWPLPPAPNDIWVEFRCRTLRDTNDFSGFLGDLRTDIGKQKKRKTQKKKAFGVKDDAGHFVVVAMLCFKAGVPADLVNAWKVILTAYENTNSLFSKIGDDKSVPVAMLAGWEG